MKTPPPENAKLLISNVHIANISQDGWYDEIIEGMPLYWQGYFRRVAENFGEFISSSDEEWREGFLNLMHDCWDE